MTIDWKTFDQQTRTRLTGKPLMAYDWLTSDPEVDAWLEHANNVVVNRMGYNDHGHVHSKIVTHYALELMEYLHKRGMKGHVMEEGMGNEADVQVVLVAGSYLHDVGNAIAREGHERLGVVVAKPMVERLMHALYGEGEKSWKMTAMVLECVVSHEWDLAHSVEASVVKVADACDMTKGRSRIPLLRGKGDIHGYSAQAIESVRILPSKGKKVKVQVVMTSTAGVFQVQEQLAKKLAASVLKADVEVEALLQDGKGELQALELRFE